MSIVVRPVRFTDDVPAMQAFLELLGLQPRIQFNRPGWVDLAGSAGLVALHEAATQHHRWSAWRDPAQLRGR